MSDWVSKIDIIRPNAYASNPANPSVNLSIPGNLVMECPMPTESIKSEDDFFSGDAEDIPVRLHYDSAQITDQLFFALTETTGLNGRFTDELNGDIVKIYNKENDCIFDGVLCVDGKGFDTADFTIKFKVFNLMRLFKERSGITANDPDGTIGKPISFLKMTAAEYSFYIRSIFKEFRAATGYSNINSWTSSPIQVVNNAAKMGIDQWFNSDVDPHDEIARNTMTIVPAESYYFHNNIDTMIYIFKNDDGRFFCSGFIIRHPYSFGVGGLPFEVMVMFSLQSVTSLQSALGILNANGFPNLTQSNLLTSSGVTYTMQYIQAADNRCIRLKGYSGKWQASNLKIKPTATIGQVVKLFLLLCGWKMSIKKNVITVTQNYYPSLSGITALTPTVSQIQDFRTNTIMPYDPVDSDIYDILDESDTAKAAIKTGVEVNYNRYLPKITKSVDFKIHSSAGIPFPGGFVIMPIVPGVPHYPGQTWNRTYFMFEVQQDQDDTEWYNCKSYNIS